ncbi:MAG: hypothetical protein GSR85_10565 [Desulfurococcales archaeon]|nr:hypothetical protein [Desulfurococcales archaeon]
MGLERELVEELSKVVARRGGTLQVKGNTLEIRSVGEPLYLTLYPSNGNVVIELKVEESIDERIDELLGEDEDPREHLEEVLETLVSMVDELERILRINGYSVIRRTREAILDVYDAIEEKLEEA